ncbi:MAG TPA: deoxyribodipyrimidine photo-lyase [Streptosporangiaceae bacterium]|nr:deoxyribodipyrimidine photo-lyase [Streptosporangiaceae bacterium]
MDTAIVLFTRDLRLHDNPALHQARGRARQVVPHWYRIMARL